MTRTAITGTSECVTDSDLCRILNDEESFRDPSSRVCAPVLIVHKVDPPDEGSGAKIANSALKAIHHTVIFSKRRKISTRDAVNPGDDLTLPHIRTHSSLTPSLLTAFALLFLFCCHCPSVYSSYLLLLFFNIFIQIIIHDGYLMSVSRVEDGRKDRMIG